MFIVDLYNGVYKTLANDTEILSLLGLTTNSTPLQKVSKIQKRNKPQQLASNIPIIAFYSVGGARDPRNDLVFGSTFLFDIFTNDDVDKAQKIANRLFTIFDNEIIAFDKIENFDCQFEDAHETDAQIPNVYCFCVTLTFFVSLDKGD